MNSLNIGVYKQKKKRLKKMSKEKQAVYDLCTTVYILCYDTGRYKHL